MIEIFRRQSDLSSPDVYLLQTERGVPLFMSDFWHTPFIFPFKKQILLISMQANQIFTCSCVYSFLIFSYACE